TAPWGIAPSRCPPKAEPRALALLLVERWSRPPFTAGCAPAASPCGDGVAQRPQPDRSRTATVAGCSHCARGRRRPPALDAPVRTQERGAMRKRFVVMSLAAGAWLAASLIAGADPALATYPGINGRLAFGLDTGNGNVDVYSVTPNGNDLRRLTAGPSFDACAAYSPDGRSIAFCSGVFTGPGQGPVQIWAMQANGNKQHQITHFDGTAAFPDYAPGGSRIAFTGRPASAPTADIYAANTDGSGLVRLTTAPGNDLFPAWSPDGSKIVFLSDRTGVLQVWVMDADGANPPQLTTDPAPKDQVPHGSPDE